MDSRLTTYLGQGNLAARIATPDIPAGGLAIWLSQDTDILSYYDTDLAAWVNIPKPLPAATTNGYVLTLVAGVPAWMAVPAAGVPEAPSDGIYYARRNTAWVAAPTGVPAATTNGFVLTLVGGVPVWATIPAGGGGATPVIRASNIQSANSSNIVLGIPASSAAGDLAIMVAGNGFAVNPVPGWVTLDNQAGSNFNGAAFSRVLTPADITRGNVTVTFAGGYYGLAGIVTFVGTTGGVRPPASCKRDSGSVTTDTFGSDGSPLPADMVLCFGFTRANGTVTISLGASQQVITGNEASGRITAGSPAATGGVLATFNYAAATNGFYEAIIAVRG